MQRRSLVIVGLLTALALLSIGSATPTNSTSPASQAQLAALEARVDDLEAEIGNLSLRLAEMADAADAAVAAVPRTQDDVFLEVADIPGESTREGHAGEIDVIGWAWAPAYEAEGRMHKPLVITKELDKASPLLQLASLRGEVLFGARLHVLHPGGDQLEYLRIEVRDMVITSVTTHSSCEGGRPCETIVLDGASFTQTYTPQRADGTPGTPVSITWPEPAP